jgi:hypothetical protein
MARLADAGDRAFRVGRGAALAAFVIALVLFAWLASFGATPAPLALQTAFALAWGTFLLVATVTAVFGVRGLVRGASSPAAVALLAVLRRFAFGMLAPAALLVLGLAALLESARGAGEQAGFRALMVFWVSFVTVPGALLVNGWVLFRAWSSRARLLGAGLIANGGCLGLSAVAVHGPETSDALVTACLEPLARLFNALTPSPSAIGLAALAYVFTLAATLAFAFRQEIRRRV